MRDLRVLLGIPVGLQTIRPRVDPLHVRPKRGRSALGIRSIRMGVGAERPKTWGGSSQKLGRIDRVWADRLWGGSTGTLPVSITQSQRSFSIAG